ncbi:MAG: GIY-YIG nuclease family protein [bacterium]|nr:GIY-YIG nuclease family protein [bacterium]
MFCVYVLESDKDGKSYTGFTKNIRQRLAKHNAGKVFSTKSRLPMRCIYIECCLNEQDARQRERYLKTGMGKRFIKQRLRHYFERV